MTLINLHRGQRSVARSRQARYRERLAWFALTWGVAVAVLIIIAAVLIKDGML